MSAKGAQKERNKISEYFRFIEIDIEIVIDCGRFSEPNKGSAFERVLARLSAFERKVEYFALFCANSAKRAQKERKRSAKERNWSAKERKRSAF